jgi:hypothetical protein
MMLDQRRSLWLTSLRGMWNLEQWLSSKSQGSQILISLLETYYRLLHMTTMMRLLTGVTLKWIQLQISLSQHSNSIKQHRNGTWTLLVKLIFQERLTLRLHSLLNFQLLTRTVFSEEDFKTLMTVDSSKWIIETDQWHWVLCLMMDGLLILSLISSSIVSKQNQSQRITLSFRLRMLMEL